MHSNHKTHFFDESQKPEPLYTITPISRFVLLLIFLSSRSNWGEAEEEVKEGRGLKRELGHLFVIVKHTFIQHFISLIATFCGHKLCV